MTADHPLDRPSRVLLMVSSAAPGAGTDVVDVRDLVADARMARREIYAAILALSDAGFVEYVGAGPRVRLTDAGMAHARALSPRAATP